MGAAAIQRTPGIAKPGQRTKGTNKGTVTAIRTCDHLSRHSLTKAARSLRRILAASAFLEHSNSLICSARRFSATARYSGATVFGSTSFLAKPTPGHPAKIVTMPRAKADLTDHPRTNTAAPEILVIIYISFR